MKRYDLVIVALFVFVVFVVHFIVFSMFKIREESSIIASSNFLLSKEIQAVNINDTDAKIEIKRMSDTLKIDKNWQMRVWVDFDDLESIKVVDGVLQIDNIANDRASILLDLDEDIEVRTNNSPNVDLLSDEQYLDKKNKNKYKYVF